ncbi:MAG TPA: ABC transporter permease [Gemmatimonadaceae bacterium]|nr:ABC transporter permease [Gemmatimonadaceae bacterium]
MIRRLRILARSLFRRAEAERELDEELRFHLERSIELHVARGMSQEAARRAALLQFGNVTLTTEESREQHRLRLLEDLAADLRYAFRVLWRSPVFTTVAVLTIALGVGANTALFGVIDAVLLRTLPVHEPEQLVFVRAVDAESGRFGGPPYPWFEHIRARTRTFSGMAVFAVDHEPVSIGGQVEQALVQIASGSYHQVAGVTASIGRTLQPDDDRLAPPVAVLGHRYWQRRFSGRREVIGTLVRRGGRSYTIVGVTAAGFDGLQTGEPVDITFPVTTVGSRVLRDASTWWCWWCRTIGRLQPGVARETVHAELSTMYSALDVSGSTKPRDLRVQLESASRGEDSLRRTLRIPLALLLAVVAAVLLIACANIANLLSVRAAARRRELAVRRAIGAGRGRIVRQLVTESVLLFALGAAAGLFIAQGLQRFLASFLAAGRNPIVLPLSLDVRVLAFTASLALTAGVLAGLAPALRAGGRSTFVDLRLAGGRAAGAWPISRALVVVQVALSITVLVGGSLFLRTLQNLRSIDSGFRSDGVVTLSVQPLGSTYSDTQRGFVFAEVLARARSTPEVQDASLSVLTPLSGRTRSRNLLLPGFESRPTADRAVYVNHVSPGFFETLGIPVKRGRGFAVTDDEREPRVAVLSEEAARYYFGSGDALGRMIAFEGDTAPPRSYSIVGVVGNSKHRSMREATARFVYLSLAQESYPASRLTLTIRTRAPLSLTADIVRRRVSEIGPDILVSDIETLQQQVDRALLQERIVSSLSLGFALLGVLLAALGLYGVTSYAVLRRTNEIGIRMALGSTQGAVRRLVLRDSLGMAATGVGIGIPVSLLGATLIQRFLYGVSPTDPLVMLVCATLLIGVTTLAGYVPALRASRIDPMRTLGAQ